MVNNYYNVSGDEAESLIVAYFSVTNTTKGVAENIVDVLNVPFCTSGSSGIGESAANLQAVDDSQAVWLDGMRFSGSSSKPDVESWISELGLK